MNFVTSNRALRIVLLAALGSVAWSPMAGALQKASPGGDANSGTFPKQFAAGAPTAAKGFSIIYEFPQNVQNYSAGGVVVDRLGNLFGATVHGGPDVYGDVYELTPAGAFTDIHDFTALAGDGKDPATGSPYLDASGNLFLTATAGGAGNAGTVIELSPSGGSYAETGLFSFDTADGAQPNASLMRRGPTLYTTTYVGGANGLGAIVALSPSNLSEKLLYSFSGLPSDGQNPASNLVADSHGNLYGTTLNGGSGGGCGGFGCGTVFKFVPTKSGGKETVLWNFGVVTNDGTAPVAPPIVDSAGNIYGTTQYGGGLTHGVVWKLTPSGGSYVESVLYWFGSTNGNNDGYYPLGGLKLVGTTLYGTTSGGGANGDNGTIFSISTTGTNYTILHSFNDNDGKYPEFATWSVKGKTLYGTTALGGIGGTGVVWRYVL